MPFEVPSCWEFCSVDEIFDLNPKNNVDENEIVGFIPMELVSAGFGYSHTYEKRKWSEVKKGYCHFQNGDIGIAKISPCFENRKSTIFYDLPNNAGAGTTELVILRGRQVCKEFYLYLFKTSWYINEGTKYFKGVVGQQRVHKDIFTILQIPLPPIKEQHRIVAAIEKWFLLIDELESNKADLQEIVKQTKRKVLDLAIHGKLVPQDPNDELAVELLKRINPNATICDTSHYENLPKGWCVVPLKETGVQILNGFAFKSPNYVNSGIKVIRITNVQDGYVCDDDPKYYPLSNQEELDKYMLYENDLLMSLTGNVGRVGFLPKEMLPAALNQRVGCLRGGDDIIDKNYLYYYLQCDTFKGDCMDSAKGVAQLNISTEWLKAYPILLPPINEQKRIAKQINTILRRLDEINADL